MTSTLQVSNTPRVRTGRLATPPVVFDTRVVTGSGGGPDKTILNSPRFLEPLGYKMLCGYLYPPGDPGYADIVTKAEKYSAPLISIPDRGPWDWKVVRGLLDVCKRENVAIWHGHDYKTNALGLLLNRFWKMRLVTTVHGWVHQTARTPLYYRIDKFCLPRYEKVICVSEDLYRECRSIGVSASKCVLLENAIDADDYRRSLMTAEAKTKLGLPVESFVIGAVGRLAEEKAFDVLIRSVHTLRQNGRDARLVIVGEGGDRKRLEALADELHVRPYIVLAGWQSDVRTYYEAMDVFALSSLREGLPNVLLEAMALEVPSVATRINGIPRVIDSGSNGTLVAPGDLHGMTAALLELAVRPDLREQYRVAGRQTIESRFSFPARMEKLSAIYDRMLSRSCS